MYDYASRMLGINLTTHQITIEGPSVDHLVDAMADLKGKVWYFCISEDLQWVTQLTL